MEVLSVCKHEISFPTLPDENNSFELGFVVTVLYGLFLMPILLPLFSQASFNRFFMFFALFSEPRSATTRFCVIKIIT